MASTLTMTAGALPTPFSRRPAEAAPRATPVLRVQRMPAQLSLFGRAQPAPASRSRTD